MAPHRRLRHKSMLVWLREARPNSALVNDACASALRASFSAPKPGR